jgi:excisionase family DNA binding protein
MVHSPKILLESEVAKRLRCSTSKVKRLRLNGELAYLPGRPVLIDEADVEAYLESAKQRGHRRIKDKQAQPAFTGPSASTESGAARALRVWQARTVREQMKARTAGSGKAKK